MIGFREQKESVAVAPVGDPHLRSVDAIDVAVARRSRGRNILQIGSRVGFRKTDSSAAFAGRERRKESTLLFASAEADQDIAQDQVGADDAREAQPTARKLAKMRAKVT